MFFSIIAALLDARPHACFDWREGALRLAEHASPFAPHIEALPFSLCLAGSFLAKKRKIIDKASVLFPGLKLDI
jgi:hypothetical protein